MYADDAPTPSSAGTTLEKVVENWRKARELRPRTVESYDGILDRHVLPQLGKRKVRELDAGAIRVWLAGLERQDGRPGELASGTRRLILSTLELVLQHAVEIGALGAVPKIEKKRRPKKGESRRRILNREEEAGLLWASPAWLRPIVTVAMREALRLGEVLGLEWSDVDFAAGKLHVRRGLSRDGSFGPCKGQTRDDFEHGKGARIELTPRAREALLELRGESDGTGLVFRNRDGGARGHRHVQGAFEAARDRAGLTATEDGPVVFHSLRHTGISRLANHPAIALVQVRDFARHVDLVTTQGYVHKIDSPAVTAAIGEAMDG